MSSRIDSGTAPSPPASWPADLVSAVDAAARLLGTARFPVVAGLGTDADGLAAALALAERLRGAIDPGTGAGQAEMRVLADCGHMATTPAETRHRADLVLLVGPGAADHAAAVGLFDDAHPLYPWRRGRDVIAIGERMPDQTGALPGSVTALGEAGTDPRPIVTTLRAAVGGRARGALPTGLAAGAVDAVAAALKAAAFGVVVYDPAALGALGTELVQGLVKDLNAGTRFSALPVPGPRSGRIHQIVAAWTTGFPLGTGFGRGYPEFDAWRFSAERLIRSGEADALVWVAPLGPDLPAWAPRERTVALVAPGVSADAAVTLAVGRPGIDHGATLYDPLRDGFGWVPAAAPSEAPAAADILARLAALCRTGAPA